MPFKQFIKNTISYFTLLRTLVERKLRKWSKPGGQRQAHFWEAEVVTDPQSNFPAFDGAPHWWSDPWPWLDVVGFAEPDALWRNFDVEKVTFAVGRRNGAVSTQVDVRVS